MKRTGTARVILLALIAIVALIAADTPTQQKGPRGGCYVVVKSKKDGHEYKRYEKCKAEAKK